MFTYEEAKAVLLKLSDITNIPLKYFIVTSIELGVNFQMYHVILIQYIAINQIGLFL